MKATYKKWYAYGKEFALPFSTTELPPFQFTVQNLPVFDQSTVEIFLVNEATGVRSATGIYPKFDVMNEHNAVLYVSPGSNVYAKSMEPGVYRAEFAIPEGETYISTPICVTDGIETNTNFVKLEYWNDEKLAYPNGFVTTGTDNDFKFQMYIPTTFFKPKYEFEEEITKRAGYKFLELQTCNKVFGFSFLAPEYICDALRLVRLSDYIRFTHDGEYYNALNFEYTPDWQDNGYLAAIECQFETDTIIQKLPSFNRRDRESFYNALLADIETPILFSPDVVGLYYREYKQGEPTIKGKMIRELSPIDMIDENTTIAVDMGAGEARKFNLYRMLEGYISKNHEDVTEFLLSLRGGVNIGTQNATGEYPASVDRDGNAKLQNIHGGDATLNNITGKDATFKTVETGFLTVNNTSATIDGTGNANVNDLTARGDSMLRSDVYTGSKNGSHTGKITKEGQLQYLSAIIYEFLSSETFVPGFLGEGFKIWLENGNWHIECDNLTVRQTMNIFELLIQKIRSVNGAIVVSQSNGKVADVEDTGTQYKITFGEEFPSFQEGDLIRCQSWSKNNLKFYWVEVKTASDGYVLCDKSEFNNVVPAVGDEVVQMGNTKNAERQALIYITAQESGKPYIEILNGVKTKSLTGTDRTRLGDLSNIVDPDFTGEAAVKGTGFYSTNAFLKGIFVLRNGKRVEDEIKIAKDAADQAAQDAANAAQSAQEAKDRLNKWADDGFISPTEKPALIDEGKRIQAEYLQIKANADKYGVLVAEYTEAYNNYLNELRYHSAATPEDIAVRPELAQSQTAYYDKRNGALNAIATTSKDYVDNADKQLKEYLDTEITAIPGKIELAVRSLKVSTGNLLKESNRVQEQLNYQFGGYAYDVLPITGRDYTLTLCYTLGANNTAIQIYSDDGYNYIGEYTTKGNAVIESKKVTFTAFNDKNGMRFYQQPNGTYGSKVHWAVLSEGNVGTTNWLPSTNEGLVGGQNLVLNSGMCISAYTLFPMSKSYYELRGKTVCISFDYEYSNLVLGSNNRFGLETEVPTGGGTAYFGTWIYLDSTSPVSGRGRKTYVYNLRYDIEDNGLKYIQAHVQVGAGTVVKMCNFQVEIGYTPTEWKPAPEDTLNESIKYTDTQILAVDGKIELTVKTRLEKTTIGGNNLIDGSKGYWFDASDYGGNVSLNYSPASNGWMSVLGSGAFNCYKQWMNVDKTAITPGKQYTLGIDVSIGGNYIHEAGLFFNIRYYEGSTAKLVADKTINLTNDTKWTRYYVTLELPSVLPSGITVNDLFFLCGLTGNNTGAGAGLIVSYKNINLVEGGIGTSWSPSANDTYGKSVEYTNQQISVVEGKITSTVEKINTVDGKVTGLASRVTQTESSINSVVERVDDQGNRLNAAEIKLDSTSVKLGVVEGKADGAQSTANSANTAAGNAQNAANAANSLAGTANSKADATNNGLVVTGIDITSRKIVLKSDNVLFQNNAGQQTAALNANGRLSANVIEAGEVVANGFAAQRITTGNLTVTDGAVIAGMTISGGVLTGKNINITDGAKVGSFTISSGIFSAQEVPAGIQMTLSGNAATFDSSGVRVENNSGSYALTTTGKGKIFLTGSDFWVQCKDVDFMGAQTWKAPGVFYACTILGYGAIGKTWGNPDFHITRVTRNSTGRYTVNTTGSNGDYFVMITGYNVTSWISTTVEPYSEGQFTYKVFDVNNGMIDSAVIIYFCGMVR